MRGWFDRVVFVRPWLTFVLMGVLFVLFGVTSFNLILMLRANVNLFLDYGTMVIDDGALRQLLQLVAYGYASLTFYMGFKTCEHVLVERLSPHEAVRIAKDRRA